MNDSSPPQKAPRKIGARHLLRLDLPSLGREARTAWRALDLGPVVAFATGVIVGLLIPSEDWIAIAIAIVIGAILARVVKAINES